MKKVICILYFSLFVFVKNSKAQRMPDTLAYLKSIVANKVTYIGKPFSVLYNALSIQLKYFHPMPTRRSEKYKETFTSFAFYFPTTPDDMDLIYPCLNIVWQTPLDAYQSYLLYYTYNKGGWTTPVYNYYKNAVIADIKIME